VFPSAVQLSSANDFDIWDAIVISAAIEAECDVLLSEDMHDGFSWGGCTIVNPFARQPHPLMAAITTFSTGSEP
jgi:predicted nucleic acid-binding protein